MTSGQWKLLLIAFLVTEIVSRFWLTKTVWREMTRFFIVMEVAAFKLVQKIYPPKYVLTGECYKRGDCCKAIVGDPPKAVKKNDYLRGLFVGYHAVMHNFHQVARGDNDEIIFACGHLGDDGRCSIYRYRPLLCRNYPVMPFFERPRILPGCGFGTARRVVSKMKPRTSLPILNPVVAVHHPTRLGGRHRQEHLDDFERIDPFDP